VPTVRAFAAASLRISGPVHFVLVCSSPRSTLFELPNYFIMSLPLLQIIYYALFAVLIYLLLDLARRYLEWRFSPLRKIPGPPPPSFLLGYMIMIFREPFMVPHKRWWNELREKYGRSLPLLCYSSLLGRYSVLLLDPDLVKTVLTEPVSRDPIRYPKNYLYIREIIGMGLVTLEGDAWSRHRRIIQPSFQANFLKESLNAVVPVRTAILIDAWRQAQGSVINLSTHMSALTLDVIGEVAFAHDFGACRTLQSWAEKANSSHARAENNGDLEKVPDPLIQAFAGSLMISGLGIALTLLGWQKLEKYLNRKVALTRRMLNEAVDNVIREARSKSASSSTAKGPPSRKSLLQLLFEATDAAETEHRKKLSDRELRDEAKTFIMAGHETTSTWCYWALYALAKYPDAQQKVYEEIIKHAKDTSTPITLEQLDEMPYLTAFMTEILRLYTPVGLIVRFTSRQETFKGYTIPPKTRLVIPIHLLHRHPDHWTNPEEFRPERWLDQESKNLHRFCFIPFSAGGRNCVGQRFAEFEAKLIIANVARAFSIQLAPEMVDSELTFTNFIAMKSKPPVKIVVKAR
jgi:cytochrome P450 family 4